MKRFPSLIFLAGIFGLGFIFKGDAVKLAAMGLVLGFLVALVHLLFDKEIRSFDARSRWLIVRTQVTYSFAISMLVAVFAVWRLSDGVHQPGSEVSAAAVFLGYALGSISFELWARKRSLA